MLFSRNGVTRARLRPRLSDSATVGDAYSEVACTTKSLQGLERFVIRAFDGAMWEAVRRQHFRYRSTAG